MKNPFRRRRPVHVAIIDNSTEVGDVIPMLCGKRLDWVGPRDNAGKVVKMCGTCMELALKEYPTEELNDLLRRMHDGSHQVNAIIDHFNQFGPMIDELVDVFNRDGAADVFRQKRG